MFTLLALLGIAAAAWYFRSGILALFDKVFPDKAAQADAVETEVDAAVNTALDPSPPVAVGGVGKTDPPA